MEFPRIKAPESDSIAVLQPDGLHNPAAPSAKLPSLAFWARSSDTRQQRRRDIKEPGRAEAPGAPQLSAQPVVAVPNRESELSDVNIAAAPAAPSPSLPVTPSATAPVRNSAAVAQNGAVDWFAGQATNVVVLSTQPIRRGIVSVPPGSIGLRSQDRGRPSAGEAGIVSPAAPDEKTPSGRERQIGTAPQQAKAHAEIGGARQIQNVQVTGPGGALTKASGTTMAGGGYEAFTRIMHPPGGNFDVVVAQSAIGGDLRGISTRLSGSPIYTVYVRVGDVQEWVLAYCLPPDTDSRNNRYEVYVEDAPSLSPPYPIVTTIPQSIVGKFLSAPVVFRGFLTAEGTFCDIEASESGAEWRSMAAIVQDWRFRPARRNNVPSRVQIALIIPASPDRVDRRSAANF
jgi:hypothetical protein